MRPAGKAAAALAALLAAALAVAGALSASRAGSAGRGAATAAPAASGAAEPARTFPDRSLYHLESSWTSDDGRVLRLADLAGKPRLLTLFFGHCEASCPMALGRLKTLEARLPKDWARHAGMVMVTLDPARDDTGSLAAFRKRMDLGREGWTLLRGGEEDTRELAMVLGVAYRPSATGGGIEHNSVLALLDARGVVLRRYEGADPGDDFMEEMRKALSGPLR